MNSEEPSDKENTKSASSQAKSRPTRSSHVLNLKTKQIRDSCRKHAPELRESEPENQRLKAMRDSSSILSGKRRDSYQKIEKLDGKKIR